MVYAFNKTSAGCSALASDSHVMTPAVDEKTALFEYTLQVQGSLAY